MLGCFFKSCVSFADSDSKGKPSASPLKPPSPHSLAAADARRSIAAAAAKRSKSGVKPSSHSQPPSLLTQHRPLNVPHTPGCVLTASVQQHGLTHLTSQATLPGASPPSHPSPPSTHDSHRPHTPHPPHDPHQLHNPQFQPRRKGKQRLTERVVLRSNGSLCSEPPTAGQHRDKQRSDSCCTLPDRSISHDSCCTIHDPHCHVRQQRQQQRNHPDSPGVSSAAFSGGGHATTTTTTANTTESSWTSSNLSDSQSQTWGQNTAADQPPAYTPPSADQLYQMVAPIALFPDKLVAQVLAGSTYPDQITAADTEVDQNPNLKGVPLQTAIAQQTWDPSVKGLTVFPTVLDQMAKNIDWTTALGEAYVNDPTDVMNAIQVMRQRASSHGSLRSSTQLRVDTQTAVAQPVSYENDPNDPVYNGPSVIPAPSQIIEIQPAEQDTVYVPEYNPQVVYGEEVPYYPGYSYERPREYSGGDVLAVGAIGFGAGILVGALFEHHNDRGSYGWNNWGMNWGGRGGNGGGYGGNNGGNYGGGGQRPAVVYNNNTYVSRSNTVVNHYVDNHNNNSTNYNNRATTNNVNNSTNNRNVGNSTVNNRPANAGPRGSGEWTFRENAGQRTAPGQPPRAMVANGAAQPNAAAPRAPMSMPHFNGTPQRGVRAPETANAPQRFAPNAQRANPANVSRATPKAMQANALQSRQATGHPNAGVQRTQPAQARPAQPVQNRPAVQQHAVERPSEVAHYTQPQHVAPPERQVQQQRPTPAPREMPAPRPAPQARPMEVTHQQQAPRPHPQPQHNGGGHPAQHAAPNHKEDKHDHR
ncbi:MAG: hypothetical protein WDW36_009544 [Sanguina aurantia]